MLHEIDADLKTSEATLDHWSKNYPGVARKAVDAKIVSEVAWAAAIEKIARRELPAGVKPPTVVVMDAEATQTCAKEIKEQRLAETELDIAKRLIGIAETALSSIQTRVKLSQIEAGLSGKI